MTDPYAPIGSAGDYDGRTYPRYVEIPPPEPPPRLPYRSDGIDWGDPINALLAGALLFGGVGVVGVLVLVVMAIVGA